ncbi:signal peptidase I [Desulfatitalea alkaliphila]|uniref:signal peptidase I n=1 Tax=Desulfatitalea alkaliphila TaxID=2929485 RepID=UPI003CCFAB2C
MKTTTSSDATADAPVTKTAKKGKLRENIEAIVIAILLAMFIRTFVVQAFKIPSGSMQDTLLIGDYILVNKFLYGVKAPFTDYVVIPVKEPQRGDVVVFRYPEDPSKDFIKRVVAVGGDTVEIRHKQVYVNGEREENPHAIYVDPRVIPQRVQPRDFFGPVTVPEGKLFTMGDNRDESNDSRFWGFVDVSAVRGKAFLIYWSWDSEDFGVRWSRLADRIE